tara:strand:- start:35 stop:616 length:582 start_codon:yes stop_codon:yes gene_type:complete
MKDLKVSNRYAKALLELAVETNNLENCYSDMNTILTACQESKEFYLLLKSPIIKTDKKIIIIEEVFSNKLSELTNGFIKIITSKKREAILDSVAKSFISLYKEKKNIISAKLVTATEIDNETREEVLDFIKKKGHKNVDLQEKIDKSIIGGAIINIGNKQIDASVSNKINEMKQNFSVNLYEQNYLNKQIWEK